MLLPNEKQDRRWAYTPPYTTTELQLARGSAPLRDCNLVHGASLEFGYLQKRMLLPHEKNRIGDGLARLPHTIQQNYNLLEGAPLSALADTLPR